MAPEIASMVIAAEELQPYTFVRITNAGLDVALPPTDSTPATVDGVVLPRAAPLIQGSIADFVILGIATVKLKDGETAKIGDWVAPNSNGEAVVDNTNGVYKVIRVHGQYVDVIIK